MRLITGDLLIPIIIEERTPRMIHEYTTNPVYYVEFQMNSKVDNGIVIWLSAAISPVDIHQSNDLEATRPPGNQLEPTTFTPSLDNK